MDDFWIVLVPIVFGFIMGLIVDVSFEGHTSEEDGKGRYPDSCDEKKAEEKNRKPIITKGSAIIMFVYSLMFCGGLAVVTFATGNTVIPSGQKEGVSMYAFLGLLIGSGFLGFSLVLIFRLMRGR